MRVSREFLTGNSLKIILPALIFIGITLAVALPRIGLPYGWDDGTSYRFTRAVIPVTTNVYHLLWQQLYAVWYDSGNPSSSYRPLNSLTVIFEVFVFGTSTTIPDFIQAALLGGTGTLIYFLVVVITGKKVVAIAASFFFSFSIPTLGFTWILLNKQPAVSLVVVLGLLGYAKYVKTESWRWLTLFWASCIIGPFLRELTVILPLTALVDTMIERRMKPTLLISLPLLTLFAFFPSFLPNLLLYHRVIILSTLTRGYSAAQLGSSGLGLNGLHYEIPYVLLLYMPYIVTILAIISISLFVLRMTHFPKYVKEIFALGFLLLCIFTIILFPILVPGYSPDDISLWILLPSIMVLGIAIFSFFSVNRLLAIWFLVSFLPFYKLYTEDVHLAPASIPWIILILLWINRLPVFDHNLSKVGGGSDFRLVKRKWRVTRIIVITIVVIGAAQQASNLYAVYSTFGGMTTEVQAMSNILLADSPSGGLAIVNFPQGGLISLYSNGSIRNDIALSNFVWPFQEELLPYPSNFSEIYPAMLNRSVFFVNESNPPVATSYGTLFNGLQQSIANLSLETGFPIIDPLDAILPRGYAQFPGPSDLEAYMVLENNLMYREYLANYSISLFNPCQGLTCLSVMNYAGCYNIFSSNNTYYGISPSQGFFNPKNYSVGDYYGLSLANSTQVVENKLNSALNSSDLRIISNNNQSIFYTSHGIDHGDLSVPVLDDDSSVVKVGMNSLSVNISSGGTFGGIRVEKVYQHPQNWCSFNTLSFWLYGLNNGDNIVFNIFDGRHNGSWFIKDDFSGWKQINIPLKQLIWCQDDTCSHIDLTNVVAFYWDFHTAGDHRIDQVELQK